MNASPPSPSFRTRSAAQGLTVRCRRSAAAMYANPVLPFDPEPVAGLVVVVLAVVAVLEAVLAAVFDTKVGHVQRRRLAVAVLGVGEPERLPVNGRRDHVVGRSVMDPRQDPVQTADRPHRMLPATLVPLPHPALGD